MEILKVRFNKDFQIGDRLFKQGEVIECSPELAQIVVEKKAGSIVSRLTRNTPEDNFKLERR